MGNEVTFWVKDIKLVETIISTINYLLKQVDYSLVEIDRGEGFITFELQNKYGNTI